MKFITKQNTENEKLHNLFDQVWTVRKRWNVNIIDNINEKKSKNNSSIVRLAGLCATLASCT